MVKHPMKACLIHLLYGNVTVDGTPVIVLTDYPPGDTTPCITMEQQGQGVKGEIIVYDRLLPLEDNHPYYDANNPDELYNQKTGIRTWWDSVMNLHIWSNSNDERNEIVSQVKELLNTALNFHYSKCTKYVSGTCTTTNNECEALTVDNYLSVQGKCPYADVTDVNDENYRNPSTIFEDEGIPIFSVRVINETDVDRIDIRPEEYHTVMPIQYQSKNEIEVDVHPVCDIGLDTPVDDNIYTFRHINLID